MIERKTYKLQIIVLNTNLMQRAEDDKAAYAQWEWLNKVLHKSQMQRDKVSTAVLLSAREWIIDVKRNGSKAS